jgi:hypothetical protein
MTLALGSGINREHGFLANEHVAGTVPEPLDLGDDADRLRWPWLRVSAITTQGIVGIEPLATVITANAKVRRLLLPSISQLDV